MYLNFLNYFRGFAIFLIVMGHSFYITNFFNLSNPIGNPFFRKLFFTMTTGGTSLFVFISGFLFHHIFYSRGFNFKKFMKNKFKNVFLPYLIIITPIIMIKFPETLTETSINISDIIRLILMYLSGALLDSTWYIPFAFVLFISSPIFIRYIEAKKGKIAVIIIGLLIGMIIHRPAHNLHINVIQALLYFSPAYCLGIYTSQNKEKLLPYLKKYNSFIFLLWVGMGVFQVHINKFMNMHKANMFAYNGIDLMGIQKIIVCLFFVGLFYKIQDKKWIFIEKPLSLLADYSFPIFFIHNYFILITKYFLEKYNFTLNFSYLGLIFFTTYICILSMIFTKIIKLIFKKNSRMIIGG